MDNTPQGIGSRIGILMLIGLFILTAFFASASVFLIKKRVVEKKQQQTTQNTTIPSPIKIIHPVRPSIPAGQAQTAQRPITATASPSAQ